MLVSAHTTTKLIIILTLLAQKACGTEIIHFIIKARLFIKTPEEYKIDSQSHKFPQKCYKRSGKCAGPAAGALKSRDHKSVVLNINFLCNHFDK